MLIVTWVLVAMAVSLLVGSAIGLADRRAPRADHLVVLPANLTVDDVLGRPRTAPVPH